MQKQKWEHVAIGALAACCVMLLAVLLTQNNGQQAPVTGTTGQSAGETVPPAAPETGNVPAAPAPVPSTGTAITREKAQEIALAEVPGAAADNVTKLKLDQDDGIQVYEVEIIYNMTEYDLEINAADGAILEFEAESVHD